jgi:hypothetical protein
MPPLSPDQLARYQQTGYLVLQDVIFPAQLVRDAAAQAASFFPAHLPAEPLEARRSPPTAKFPFEAVALGALNATSLAPPLLEAAAQLLGLGSPMDLRLTQSVLAAKYGSKVKFTGLTSQNSQDCCPSSLTESPYRSLRAAPDSGSTL